MSPQHIEINDILLSLFVRHKEKVTINDIPTKNIRMRLFLINFSLFLNLLFGIEPVINFSKLSIADKIKNMPKIIPII